MHPENEKIQIRTAILELSTNLHQRRYPNPLREQIVVYTDAVLYRGGTYTEVERDLGISSDTLRRFRRARHEGRNSPSLSALKTAHNFLPVKCRLQRRAVWLIISAHGAVSPGLAPLALQRFCGQQARINHCETRCKIRRCRCGVGFIAAHCWSHARRNVLKAEGEAPGQVKEFLDLVDELYEIERKAVRTEPKEDAAESRGYRHLIDEDLLRRLRDAESREVINKIQKWILAQRCIPGGRLKAGLTYVAQRWKGLTRFLDDPHIPLDNNLTERSYIGLAIGRRNYLGARSERGMLVAGLFYSLLESARLVGADPAKYLRDAAIAALAGDAPLLPHEWVQRG